MAKGQDALSLPCMMHWQKELLCWGCLWFLLQKFSSRSKEYHIVQDAQKLISDRNLETVLELVGTKYDKISQYQKFSEKRYLLPVLCYQKHNNILPWKPKTV